MFDNSETPVAVTALALIGAYVVARKGARVLNTVVNRFKR